MELNPSVFRTDLTFLRRPLHRDRIMSGIESALAPRDTRVGSTPARRETGTQVSAFASASHDAAAGASHGPAASQSAAPSSDAPGPANEAAALQEQETTGLEADSASSTTFTGSWIPASSLPNKRAVVDAIVAIDTSRSRTDLFKLKRSDLNAILDSLA
jgi:hypothetical protein